jgi:hypothetical protein
MLQFGTARRALGQVSLLALLGVASGCGGRQTDATLDGGARDLAQEEENTAASAVMLSAAQMDAAAVPLEQANTPDTSGGAWRVIEVPGLSSPTVVHSPLGWLALSSRSLGDSRAPSGYQSALYRSTDGVHWSALPLDAELEKARLWGLAYGSGRYVIVGQPYAGTSALWSSSDARDWLQARDPSDNLPLGGGVAYAHQRFFKVGFKYVTVSEDGRDWRLIPITLVQSGSAAYGNGRYVLSGSGPFQVSENGWDWQERPLDCTVSPGCITDPSGVVHQGYHPTLLFAEGRFYTDELSSADGLDWRTEPGLRPRAYAGGYFFGNFSASGALSAWVNGGPVQWLRVVRPAREAETAAGRESIGTLARDAPVPESVNVEFEDGLTCENASCVLIGDRLLLVPPAGTPPLVDRVPRTLDGAPLLSRDCPVSSQIRCDDYAARSGCTCLPEAPASPAYCQDVSQFRCAGRFTPRPSEWQLDEVSLGGCSCDAVDPNQPPSFGLNCEADPGICTSPLRCLPVDPIPSAGPPNPRSICTSACQTDADCPSWEATGFCAGAVRLRCSNGSCQPRACD